ncbi:CLUMA_CG002313, isoform A [Clunio marinus]|uniref:CLUMA_CG002313, isoform A n=1 Tax=Clunio marinus TaxID=568069 RepID=A0A1J1HQN4_9DIPT|nr:CLUMA_CG002313, isoform A [Clunio marinus]
MRKKYLIIIAFEKFVQLLAFFVGQVALKTSLFNYFCLKQIFEVSTISLPTFNVLCCKTFLKSQIIYPT